MNGRKTSEMLPEELKRQILELRSYGGTAFNTMGMSVTDLGPGWAEGIMEIQEHHLNPMRTIHGGFLFTFADSIGGTAACTRGNLVATTNASFNFLNPGIKLKRIKARAEELKGGKRLLTYEVSVTSEDGVLLAKGVFEYHNFGVGINECEKLYAKQ